MTGAKKVIFMKNQFLHGRQPCEEIFWILFMLWLYLHDWFLKLYEVIFKLCDFGACSYLDNKCSPSLCLPAIPCTKLGMKYGFPLKNMFSYCLCTTLITYYVYMCTLIVAFVILLHNTHWVNWSLIIWYMLHILERVQ